ncbi:MAG: type II secretion system F family protein [Firmicutes bacterium]|nr:type II secretion system F family protein [Bacillota bacterium]
MKKDRGQITAEKAVRKTRKQITAVVLIGIMLIISDLVMSYEQGIAVENSYGQLYLIRPEAGGDSGHLSLKAEIEGENGIYEKKINVMLEPYVDEKTDKEAAQKKEAEPTMTEEENYEYSLRTFADTLNSDRTVKKVSLPAKLETGEKIHWEIEKASRINSILILIMMVLISAIMYRERFSSLKKMEAANRASVSRQLPGFINRLVLLIEAGMVVNSAFEKAVEESIGDSSTCDDYFYGNLKGVYTAMKTANGSMSKGLKDFARRSGVQELMRVSNIIEDNVNKGTELTDKLRSESDMLWMDRKKKCEEMGRLAETKLTLPLMLFLIVLIVITVAPALLEL